MLYVYTIYIKINKQLCYTYVTCEMYTETDHTYYYLLSFNQNSLYGVTLLKTPSVTMNLDNFNNDITI